MKSVVKWSALSLVVYLVFLLSKLPAAVVLANIKLPTNVSVSQASGSIWQGHAQNIVINGVPIFNLNWQLSFVSLLIGNLDVQLQAGNMRNSEDISIRGQVNLSQQHIDANNLTVYLPTDLIISILPLPIPVQADGRFKVQIKQLAYQSQCQTLEGQGEWLNASFIGATGDIDLGSFAATLGCEDGKVIVDIQPPNRFGLTAKVAIPADFKFSVEGRFKPEASLPREVHQAAQFFGQPDAQGYYPIRL
ncbi:type II secretion system protein N [Paraglaciecola aestuariivivens]